MHGFEGHDFRRPRVGTSQQFLQVSAVVVAEDVALGTAVPDALNHRSVVPHVRVDLTACTSDTKCHKAPKNELSSVSTRITFSLQLYLHRHSLSLSV